MVGGVNNPANFQPYVSGDPSPLHTGALPEPDPLRDLLTPIAGTAGVNTTYRGAFKAKSDGTLQTLDPGIYDSIETSNGANVKLNPGIYILKATGTSTIKFTGSGIVRGTGVMFYNTGSDFNVSTGEPDASDGYGPVGSIPNSTKFGGITINGSDVQLTGLINDQSPINGMLIYQRRWNTAGADIQGGTSTNNNVLAGTIYAKWANFKLAGSGKYDAQFIVGSMALAGTANIILNYEGKNLGKANNVFLVE